MTGRRLRVQLVLIFGALVAVATAASGVLSYTATRDEAIGAVDEFLDRQALRGPGRGADAARPTPDEFARLLEQPPPVIVDPADGANVAERRFVGDDSLFTLLDADGAIVVTSDDDIALPTPASTTTGSELATVDIDGVRYRLRTEVFDDGSAALTARSMAETDLTLAAVRNRLLVIAVLITAIAVVVAWFVAGRIARPLQRLSAAAEHITATGDLTTPLDTAAKGEVGQVATSFAGMLAAFGRSRAQQQQLVVDAGHELRTPLTTLRTNVELLRSGRLTETDRERALELVGAEVDELSNLTAELVELAGDQPIDHAATRVDLVDIAHAAAARAMARSGRDISVRGVAAPVDGNAAGLDRAISNLLGNALKFSSDDTPIVVDVRSDAVTVGNVGPPIPADDLDHVFERFYRVSTARSLPGSGLGLAIVAEVARAHGGSGFVRNVAGGVEVGFTLTSDPQLHRSRPNPVESGCT